MASVRITRGRLTALWLVLRTAQKLGGQAESSEVLLYARRSGLRGGELPIDDGLRLAREGQFVVERAGVLALGPLGDRALAISDDDEPPKTAITLFVSVLLLAEPPAWVPWWQGASAEPEAVIPEDEQPVMREAGLLPQPEPLDPAGWAWWHALGAVPLPEQTALRRKHIGDAGEELTVKYEQWRLAEGGRPDLAAQVRWVAQENDAYGFDVLSFAGPSSTGLNVEDPIAIEVKSTSLPALQVFPLYLTAHEWQAAETLGDRHRLHLWTAVDPGPPPRSANRRPFVISAAELVDHLPSPSRCGEGCGWQSASLKLQLPRAH